MCSHVADVIRAEEQGKLDINSTVEHNVTQVDKELDLEFYLGIYGGDLYTESAFCTHAHFACCKTTTWDSVPLLPFHRFDRSHHHFWFCEDFDDVQRAGEKYTGPTQQHV